MFKSYQEAFDATVEHLAKQKSRAVAANGACLYLTDDGRKCAVGAHIPDGHLAQHFAGSFSRLMESYPSLWSVFSVEGCNMMNSTRFWELLQGCHDDSQSLRGLQESLKILSKDYNLADDKISTITEWS